jgi:hypothetical protein
MSKMTPTKFEEDLKVYFPDIYQIHTLGKFDHYIWDVFNCMLEFTNKNEYGEIIIQYQNGKINRISRTTITTSGRDAEPDHSHPNYLDE